MSAERVLRRRLRTLETLDEAVGALRALSAQHFRIARARLPAARAYHEEMDRMLGALGTGSAPPPGPTTAPAGVVLFAADLGLVGDYTSRLVRESLYLRSEHGPGPLFCLGRRAVPALERAGVRPSRIHAAASSVASSMGVLLPLVDEILAMQRTGELGAVWLVAARFEGAGHFRPVRLPLLPVSAPPDRQRLGVSPYCDGDHLRAVVVREVLVATLHETLLESLASEHGKRLVMAESARSWLEERTERIRRLARKLRRDASTQEVLEVATAARAATRQREAGGGAWTQPR